jgi:hypothetical protein
VVVIEVVHVVVAVPEVVIVVVVGVVVPMAGRWQMPQ